MERAMQSMGVMIGGFFIFTLMGFSLGYICGLERGMKIPFTGSALPDAPKLLRSPFRRERRKPISVSEFEQARREPKDPPLDPS